MQNRFGLSLLFVLLILGAAFSFKWMRWIFSNRVVRFLSGISFNFYIWHQVVSLKCKEWRLPYWEAEDGLPQASMGRAWQWKYTAVIWIASLAVAIFFTYCVERPADRMIMKGYERLRGAVRKALKKDEAAKPGPRAR